jgi:hypothetical protein
MRDRNGLPLTVSISAANRNDHLELEAVVDAVVPVKVPVGRPRRRPRKLHADKGNDYPSCRKALRRRGIIARKRLEAEHVRGLEVLKAIDDADTAVPR